MREIIRGQVIATTGGGPDTDPIPAHVLRQLFDSLPDESLGWDNHDPSKPPISRAFNKRLETLPNGNLAIKVDVEVLDKTAFDRMGGFSIAFTRTTWQSYPGEPMARCRRSTNPCRSW